MLAAISTLARPCRYPAWSHRYYAAHCVTVRAAETPERAAREIRVAFNSHGRIRMPRKHCVVSRHCILSKRINTSAYSLWMDPQISGIFILEEQMLLAFP